MTEQEAIKILYKMPNRVPLKIFTDGMAKEIDEMIQVAQAALEKQIPKDVNGVYQARIEELPGKCILSGNCPVCESPVPKKHRYCWSCGQRLEWPEN